jgi:antitoxin ParD1/3/4
MSDNLNVQLTNELRRYVDSRASDNDVYATPSEYIRDLIRKDMSEQSIVRHVMQGLADLKADRFSSKSILDIMVEKGK